MMTTCDVLVVGGGPAGVTAAAAAAERGAHTILVDARPDLGGTVSAGMHEVLCGLYAARPDSPEQTLSGGLQREIVERLGQTGDCRVVQLGRTWVLQFAREAWRPALWGMLKARAVEVRTGWQADRTQVEGGRLVSLTNARGETIKTGAVVDCSGVGSVLAMAGAAQAPDTQRPLAGFCALLRGIRGTSEMLHLRVPYVLRLAAERGELPHEASFTTFRAGPGPGEGVLKLACRAAMGTEVTSMVEAVLVALRREIEQLEHVVVAELSPGVLPRDGRRLAGETTLSELDVLSGTQHQVGNAFDRVQAWWPIEYWSEELGPLYEYPPDGRAYEISLGTVRSASVTNLLAAGSCLSATSRAMASARVAGICLASGELAGRAACETGDRSCASGKPNG